MNDPAPLTDDDLAHLEKAALSFGHLVTADALRLIAALRASRAEVERLRECLEPGKAEAILAGLWDEAERLGHSPFSSIHATTYVIREIERLRAELDETQLRSIEARNPGIDMDEVRRLRAAP